MRNNFCKTPLWECNNELVRVAQGARPADLVIRHASLVSVTTHEVLPDTDIAVARGRVAYLGLGEHTAEHCIGPDTQVVDARGLYAAPGLMDSHIHIESAMIGPAEYARARAGPLARRTGRSLRVPLTAPGAAESAPPSRSAPAPLPGPSTGGAWAAHTVPDVRTVWCSAPLLSMPGPANDAPMRI